MSGPSGERLPDARCRVTAPGGAAAGTLRIALDPGLPVRVVLALLLAGSVAASTWLAARAAGTDPGRPDVVDFHPFYLAGRLALEGRYADSYDVPRMHALLSALAGRDVLIPFVYPPSFGLVLAPLALLPLGVAFLAFASATLGLYVAALRRLAGPHLWTALAVATPCIVVDLRMGQNGLLTGALAGFSAAALLRGRSGTAGTAAGLLVFKPQVAVALPMLFALRRDRRALAAAGAAAVIETALGVWMFDVDSLRAFLGSTPVLADLAARGSLHFDRLTSVYASAASLGIAVGPALALHVCALLPVAAAAAAAVLRGREGVTGRGAAGLLLMSTAFVSPYFSGYDLPVPMAGLALLLPDLVRALPPGRAAALLACTGLAGLVSVPLATLGGALSLPSPSLGGPLLLACFLAVAGSLGPRPIGRRAIGPGSGS